MPTPFLFNTTVKTGSSLPQAYRQLQRELARLGYVSQGSVFERSPGQQGSHYVWTRKVRAKTVTVALSLEQYRWLRQAVDNQRKLESIVGRMQTLSRQILFETVPGVVRRKRLSKKVLGLIQGPFRTDTCMTPAPAFWRGKMTCQSVPSAANH